MDESTYRKLTIIEHKIDIILESVLKEDELSQSKTKENKT